MIEDIIHLEIVISSVNANQLLFLKFEIWKKK